MKVNVWLFTFITFGFPALAVTEASTGIIVITDYDVIGVVKIGSLNSH